GEQIKVTYNFDPKTRLASWYMRSYVDSTYDHFPKSAYDGFLPPNNKEIGDGEGYVSFTVSPKAGLETGTRIETSATIVFDRNDPIDTNVWVNTLDVDAPTLTSVTAQYDETARSFTVNWSGNDADSGVGSYSVFYSVDGGNTFVNWIEKTTESSGVYAIPGPEFGNYVFKAVVYDGAGNVAEGITEAVSVGALQEAPGTPTNLTVSGYVQSNKEPLLRWNESFDRGATSEFKVYQVVESTPTLIATIPANTTYVSLATVTTLQDNSSYRFAVSAVNDYGVSDYAYITLDTTISDPTPTAPNAPSNLTVGEFDATTRSITVSWTDNSDDEIGFLVQYSTDGENWFDVQVGADTTTATLSDLELGATYTVRVAATNDVGASAFVSGSFTTSDAHETHVAPTNVTFGDFDASNGSITVSWADNSSNETGFLVQYSTDGENWIDVTIDSGATSATLDNLAPGVTYTVRVAATNDSGTSEFVAYSFTTPNVPNAPSDLTVGAFDASTRSISVSWTDNSDDETSFLVQYSSDGTNWNDVSVSADIVTATLAQLAYETTYTVRVAARNEIGDSAFVSSSLTTPAAPS
ncbi:MAG: fibronectin type III domain-containing protein, partial [Thermoguttaceae bacterium]|nr:fibronectin type III domain-containing protein [Thermoguttaceae bacterium]